ncbi:NTP transferase domain-containing protein [Sphingomonas sp.]|uniref:NTP transferase domain-containing protein n=1 Tax=Sphingomonas sp. TaxID=28214 RepID=UPI000DB2AE10|nr:NTP transferase domain-containing protein [Sphingomonas sp.]PZU11878.1 MAG: hypothetical protein DI605_02690 [Sphingomonas sp.]
MIYILLGAGSGTRMGTLTSDRAKVLVQVEGRAILAHNLANIATADPAARVRIITGFGADAVAAFVREHSRAGTVETVFNPDYAVAGPLRSVDIGLTGLGDDEPVTIGNGDTIFEPRALAALAAAPAGAALLGSPAGTAADEDDVQLLADGDVVRVAAKRLGAAGSLPVSAGLLQIRGAAALAVVREAVRAGLMQEKTEGRALTWHSIIARLGAIVPQVVMVPRDWWWEFDSPDCIERYHAHVIGQNEQASGA